MFAGCRDDAQNWPDRATRPLVGSDKANRVSANSGKPLDLLPDLFDHFRVGVLLGSNEFLEEIRHRVGEHRSRRSQSRAFTIEDLLKAAETTPGLKREELCSNTKTRKVVAVKEAMIVLGRRSVIRNRELAAALAIDPSAVTRRIDAARAREEETAWLSSMTYSVAGQLTGDTIGAGGGATNETFAYDSQRLRINSQTAVKGATTLMSLTYSYQAQVGQNGVSTTAGNVGQLMSASGTINQATESASYTYDLLGRLATSSQTMNGTSSNRKFAYERWGNRTSVWDDLTGTHQIQSVTLQQSGGAPTNRLTSVTTNGAQANYLYDSAGNVTSDGAHTYVYDGENRVVSVDGGAQTFAYDQKNRRVKKVSGGTTTHLLWEGNKVLAEYDGSTGSTLTQYVGPGGRLIAKVSGAVTRYYLSDRLSERLVLDVNGNVVGQQAHLPYGEVTGGSGEQEKHHFTTYETDSETGLDYAVNRYDNPNLGRFTTADPMAASAKKESPQSFNRYTYTQNDPINLVDPTGLFACIGCDEELNPCNEGGVTALFGSASLAQFCIELGPTVPEIIETGPEQTQGTCKITVRADALTPGNNLSFGAYDKANSTTLGPSSVGVEGAGWFFRYEAHGTLTGAYRGTATQWHLERTQELYDRVVYRLPDGTLRPARCSS